MNPYLQFAFLSFAAFIAGVSAYSGAHAVVAGTPTNWLLLVEAGLASMGTYWWGTFTRNPFAAKGTGT